MAHLKKQADAKKAAGWKAVSQWSARWRNKKEDTAVKEQTDLIFYHAVVSMFIIIAAALFVFWK